MNKHQQGAVLLLAVVLLGLYIYLSHGQRPQPTPSIKTSSTIRGLKYIQLSGEVISTGLYAFYCEPSLGELLERAGGLKNASGPSPEILSQKIPAGMRVIIDVGPNGTNEVRTVPMTSAARFILGIPMPLNRATEKDLQFIPGIGPKLAQRIVAFRAQNGPYKNVAELDAVKGLGEKKLKQMAPYVTLEN